MDVWYIPAQTDSVPFPLSSRMPVDETVCTTHSIDKLYTTRTYSIQRIDCRVSVCCDVTMAATAPSARGTQH